jgi:hypothetical protein
MRAGMSIRDVGLRILKTPLLGGRNVRQSEEIGYFQCHCDV